MKIYTRSGDNGKTGLIGGSRVFKSDPRIAAYGQIDELNANIGLAISVLSTKGVHKNFTDIVDLLIMIQNDLFIVGSDLADPNFPPTGESKTPRVADRMITNIERAIDKFESELEPISYFIIPGGCIESSILHVCRGVARRAEVSLVTLVNSKTINKCTVAYVNRLSDLLFVLARAVNKRQKINDVAWKSEY